MVMKMMDPGTKIKYRKNPYGAYKCGVLIRLMDHTVYYRGPQIAVVKFEGNGGHSQVPYRFLVRA